MDPWRSLFYCLWICSRFETNISRGVWWVLRFNWKNIAEISHRSQFLRIHRKARQMESFFSKNGTETYFTVNTKTVPSVFSLQIYMQICKKGILPKLSVEFVYIHTEYEKQPPEMLYKKAVINNFAIFAGKHMWWSLFLIKLQIWRPEFLLKQASNTGVFKLLKSVCKFDRMTNLLRRIAKSSVP